MPHNRWDELIVEKDRVARVAFDLMNKIERDKDENPVTLEGVIRSVILKSPDRFQYRDDALGLIYCVLGAHVDWNRSGRIGDSTPNNYMNMPPDAGGQGVWAVDFGLHETTIQMGEWGKRLLEDATGRMVHEWQSANATVLDIEERCQNYNPKVHSWYPISWYACRLACPENVQEDFLAGAAETCELITQTQHPLATEKWLAHQRTKHVAEMLLPILRERMKPTE